MGGTFAPVLIYPLEIFYFSDSTEAGVICRTGGNTAGNHKGQSDRKQFRHFSGLISDAPVIRRGQAPFIPRPAPSDFSRLLVGRGRKVDVRDKPCSVERHDKHLAGDLEASEGVPADLAKQVDRGVPGRGLYHRINVVTARLSEQLRDFRAAGLAFHDARYLFVVEVGIVLGVRRNELVADQCVVVEVESLGMRWGHALVERL